MNAVIIPEKWLHWLVSQKSKAIAVSVIFILCEVIIIVSAYRK